MTLNEAYENLASPDKRDAYDRQRGRPRESQAGGGLRSLLQRFRHRYSEPQIPEP